VFCKVPHRLKFLVVSPPTKNFVSAAVTALSVSYPKYSHLIKPNNWLFRDNLDDPQNITGEAVEHDGTFESAPSVGVAPPVMPPAYAAGPAGSACSQTPPSSSPGTCEPLPDCRRPCEETRCTMVAGQHIRNVRFPRVQVLAGRFLTK
jgi:hypothetical protein